MFRLLVTIFLICAATFIYSYFRELNPGTVTIRTSPTSIFELNAVSLVLLAMALGLSACEKTPEDKMDSAKENVSEAMESLGDAAEDVGEATEKKVDQATGHEPTTGEKLQEAAEDAGEAIQDAGDEAKDAVDGQ